METAANCWRRRRVRNRLQTEPLSATMMQRSNRLEQNQNINTPSHGVSWPEGKLGPSSLRRETLEVRKPPHGFF